MFRTDEYMNFESIFSQYTNKYLTDGKYLQIIQAIGDNLEILKSRNIIEYRWDVCQYICFALMVVFVIHLAL